VTTDERVIAQLAEANPVPDAPAHTVQERAEAERVLRRVLDDAPAPRRRRPRLGILAPVASVLVVLAVAAVVLRTGGSSTTGANTHGGVEITLSAQPTPQTPRITATAMSREVALMRRRLVSLGHGFTVQQSGASGIVVTGPKVSPTQRSRIVSLITQSAQLAFYDWEANVLTPNGKTAASQLLTQHGTVLSVSQGTADGPGFPGAGSMSLYDAVTLAAKQPLHADHLNSRSGSQYYMFGAPGSTACAAAAAANRTRPISGTHCLLAGPVSLGSAVSRRHAIDELAAQLPAGVSPTEGQVLVVRQGTVVLQAEQFHSAAPVGFSSPTAQFFVLKDDVALRGNEITNPQSSADQGGEPDVTFGFTGAGQSNFQKVTGEIAHRGANVSLEGNMLNQHFAVVLDSQIVTVPSIGFRQYPDGITPATGADIVGGLTAQTATDLATELRYGALPLNVRVVP
jgi:preprotein translocase subunit SecD